MYQAVAVWLPEILTSVLNRGEQSGSCLGCFNPGERALIAYELGWHWSPAGIELCLLHWPLVGWSLCGLSYLAQSDSLCELFNEPLKVWILCWQSVSYRKVCQGIRVWYPAGTCDFLTASISAVEPTWPPIQHILKMLKGLESLSRQVSHCSWFVCWMSLRVMKHGFVDTTQKQNIRDHYIVLCKQCPKATHRRVCQLCQVSLTNLFCLLAVLTDFLWFLFNYQTSHCIPHM